jgi:hypothetical protein
MRSPQPLPAEGFMIAKPRLADPSRAEPHQAQPYRAYEPS